MRENKNEKYDYKYIEFPPYEVLSNCFIKYEELVKLKNIEKMLDYYYNSEKFKHSIKYIVENYYKRPFDLFEDIAKYYNRNNLLGIGHKVVAMFDHLVKFFEEKNFQGKDIFIEYLKLDYLLLGKPGMYPEWFISNKDKEKYNAIVIEKNYASVREGYKKTEFEKFEYDVINNKKREIEIFFDYSNKKIKLEIF